LSAEARRAKADNDNHLSGPSVTTKLKRFSSIC